MSKKLTIEEKREFILKFYQYYWEERMSLPEVAKVFGLSYIGVHNRIIRFNLPLRTSVQGQLVKSQKIRKKRLLERIAKFPQGQKHRSEAMKKFWKEVKSGKKYKSDNT